MSDTPTFLLPGRPVACSLTPEALCAYLIGKGWHRVPSDTSKPWSRFEGPWRGVEVYSVSSMTETLEVIAAHERRHPLDVLADAGGRVVPAPPGSLLALLFAIAPGWTEEEISAAINRVSMRRAGMSR